MVIFAYFGRISFGIYGWLLLKYLYMVRLMIWLYFSPTYFSGTHRCCRLIRIHGIQFPCRSFLVLYVKTSAVLVSISLELGGVILWLLVSFGSFFFHLSFALGILDVMDSDIGILLWYGSSYVVIYMSMSGHFSGGTSNPPLVMCHRIYIVFSVC